MFDQTAAARRKHARLDKIVRSSVLALLSCPTACLAGSEPPSSYVCVAERTAGFKYDPVRQSWESASFRSDGKYLVRKVRPGEDATYGAPGSWAVFEVGKQYSLAGCDEPKPVPCRVDQATCDKIASTPSSLSCHGLLDLMLVRSTLRFESWRLGGFPFQPNVPENNDSPAIEIGACSPLG